VGIVGSRQCTGEGEKACGLIAEDIAGNGGVVISGLAQGIDTIAHRNAVKAGGRTVAFTGVPLDEYFPKVNESFQKELEKDCLELMKIFESRTDNDNNHFTEKDVLDALQSFEDKELVTYPINSIANRSGLEIIKNERKGRKQVIHLEIARAQKAILKKTGDIKPEGRPAGASQQREKIRNWRKKHPDGTPKDCIKAKIASKNTVYRWWNEKE